MIPDCKPDPELVKEQIQILSDKVDSLLDSDSDNDSDIPRRKRKGKKAKKSQDLIKKDPFGKHKDDSEDDDSPRRHHGHKQGSSGNVFAFQKV